MNKTLPILTMSVAAILTVFIVTQPIEAQTNIQALQGEPAPNVPDWVKTTSGFWANGDISDTEYINAIEYLLKEQIMTVPSTVQTAEGQEITQSIEVLQQRVDDLESYDDEESEANVAILEKQILALDGDPQALKSLDDEELVTKDCGDWPEDSHSSIKLLWAMCHVSSWILDESDEESEEQKQQQIVFDALGQQIQKAELVDLDEPPAIPAGATGTYVKYKKGETDNNFRLTVECDPGDVATGGGFSPQLQFGEIDYHGSMPYPTNYASNPRMNNPTGWTFFSMEPGEARVWVVCLDLTPSGLATGSVP